MGRKTDGYRPNHVFFFFILQMIFLKAFLLLGWDQITDGCVRENPSPYDQIFFDLEEGA